MDDKNNNFYEEQPSFESKFDAKSNFENFKLQKSENGSIDFMIKQFKRGSSEIITEFKKREAYLGPSKKRQIKDLNAKKRKSKRKFKVFQKSY